MSHVEGWIPPGTPPVPCGRRDLCAPPLSRSPRLRALRVRNHLGRTTLTLTFLRVDLRGACSETRDVRFPGNRRPEDSD